MICVAGVKPTESKAKPKMDSSFICMVGCFKKRYNVKPHSKFWYQGKYVFIICGNYVQKSYNNLILSKKYKTYFLTKILR